MVSYTLYYFPIRARGEIIRQIFAVAGQKYEDVRIPKKQWSDWQKKMPFGQLPVLEEDGKMLAQSHSIARYLARKFDLSGQNPWEEAQVDSLADQWKDFQTETRSFWIAYTGRGGDLEKLKKDVFLPAAKKHFPFYVNAVKNSEMGYLVGNALTWVDLLVAEFIAGFDDYDKKLLDDFPVLREHKTLVRNIPSLRKWIETRPQSSFDQPQLRRDREKC